MKQVKSMPNPHMPYFGDHIEHTLKLIFGRHITQKRFSTYRTGGSKDSFGSFRTVRKFYGPGSLTGGAYAIKEVYTDAGPSFMKLVLSDKRIYDINGRLAFRRTKRLGGNVVEREYVPPGSWFGREPKEPR